MNNKRLFKELTIASMISFGIISAFLLFNPFKQNLVANQSEDPAVEKLIQDIDSLVTHYESNHYTFGIRVTSTQNNETLYSKNEDMPFVPASNLKLFPSAVALETLGPGFKWKTQIYADGQVLNGVLNGDLVIKTEGDPSISENYLNSTIDQLFKHWALEIKKQGITVVKGNVVMDHSAFNNTVIGKGWKSDYEQSHYAAPPSAFSINENYITIRVSGARKNGKSPIVSVYPYNGSVKIINKAVTAKVRKNSISVRRDANENIIYVYGKIRKNKVIHSSINLPKPADYASAMLFSALIKNKIMIKGKLKTSDSPYPTDKLQSIYTYESPELSHLLKRINKNSNNFMANQMFLTLGYKIKQDAKQSETIIKSFLEDKQINTSQLVLDDGSGLSPLDQTTPRQFSDLLQYMSQSPVFNDFYDSFPVAGIDGTLKNVMKYEPLYKNVRGKTGTINEVKSLCGYIHTRDNEMLTFTILANDIKANRYKIYQFNNEFLTILGNFSRNMKSNTVMVQSDSVKFN
jgi:PBP4 family serine-type D-alanyl-D-alanine carboxypeptidase